MNSKKFNQLVNASLENIGDEDVLNLGTNGQVSFALNEDEPWSYTKVIHTELGSQPIMQCFDDFEDVLAVIGQYVNERMYGSLGPFMELQVFKRGKFTVATAHVSALNTNTCELETVEVLEVAEVEEAGGLL